MSNKLRDMFDDSKQEYTEKVFFENVDKYNSFIDAIKKATEEGIPSEVDGITGINVSVKDGDSIYPLRKHESVDKVMIFPQEILVEIEVDTDKGKRILRFKRTDLKDKYILQNIDGKGALYKITYDVMMKTVNVDYSAAYNQAKSLEELSDYYNSLYYFTKKMFVADSKNEDIDTIMNRFLSSVLYFERLIQLSKLLNITITPRDLEKIDDDDLFIERVYFSLVENKAIRSNRKVTSMNNVHFQNDKRPGEEPMIFTYLEQGRMFVADNEIDVYIISMAFNLIIDKEENDDSGESKIYFKDTENNPMYIVSRMFLNENEARKEVEAALNNKKPYEEAKTLFDYIKESHEAVALTK